MADTMQRTETARQRLERRLSAIGVPVSALPFQEAIDAMIAEERKRCAALCLDRPVSPRAWRWFLFTRVDLCLWSAPMLLIFSAAFHNGRPGEFSEGGAAVVVLLWVMAKLRERADAK